MATKKSKIDFYRVEDVSDRWAIGFTQEGDEEPVVWFLDKKYPFEESHGITFQNTGASYYVSTIANHEGMLDLWGDVPAWKVPGHVIDVVRPICEDEYDIWQNKGMPLKSSLSHEELIEFSHDIAKQIITEKISQDEAVDMIMEKMNCNRSYANGLLMRWVLNEATYNGMVMTNSRKPIKSGFVINYYDEAGYVEDNFIDANAKGLVSSPIGAMTFDTMDEAQFWIDTEAENHRFDPDYCEIQPIESSRKLTSARFLAEDDNGNILAEADTYEEAQSVAGCTKVVDTESHEGQEEMGGVFQSREITSANNYGWVVDSSDAMKALDMWIDYVGKESALEDLARALSTYDLVENLEYVCREFGYAEEIEDIEEPWSKFEYAKELIGAENLLDNLSRAIGYDELAECMAYIFRMNDFQEWDSDYEESESYEEFEEDEDIMSNHSFPVETVKKIMSGLWTEKQATINISQKQDVNVAYAEKILSSWINTYKPKLIQSGILDIADDINKEFNIDGDLDSWFEDYVPQSGKANTVGGEIVRAAQRILYRWYNDGDMIGSGYGNQTCNPAARLLINYLPDDRIVKEEIESLLNRDKRLSDEEYDSFAETLKSDVEDFLRDNEKLFHQPNKTPYEDFTDPNEDKDTSIGSCIVSDSDGNEYYFDDIGSQWKCTEVSIADTILDEDDYISDSDEYADYIDASEEWGSFEVSGVKYEYEATDDSDEDGMHHEWKITSVMPSDPFCDKDDILDYYDLEPDNLGYGLTLHDFFGNEIDERTFLASSLIKSSGAFIDDNESDNPECIVEINVNGKWEPVGIDNSAQGWTTSGKYKVFKSEQDARKSALIKRLEDAGYSEDTGTLKFSTK